MIESHRPPRNWPSEGHVKFDHYSTRYREGLSLVLRDITVDIPGGTKVSTTMYTEVLVDVHKCHSFVLAIMVHSCVYTARAL